MKNGEKMVKKNILQGRLTKIVLLALAFLMTIIITFTVTVAWFYDSDWADNKITMGGKVSVYLTNGENTDDTDDDTNPYDNLGQSGSKSLHFQLFGGAEKAYPGQTIDVKTSVYNDGDSDCFIRAKFMVATDVTEPDLDLANLYLYLHSLVQAINSMDDYDYCWVYDERNHNNSPIYFENNYYLNGVAYPKDTWEKTMDASAKFDTGYYYLCQKVDGATSHLLKPITKSSLQTFFMDGTFLIPWTLTNSSASCNIYAAVQFQAIQTFIPVVYNPNETNASSKEYNEDSQYHGTISKAENNRFPEDSVKYDTYSAQVVWNSCVFDSITADWATNPGYTVQSGLPKTD